MVKPGVAVVSSPTGTAAMPGPTWVTIQSSTSGPAVGVLPSSSPGEGATETPKGDMDGEGWGLLLTSDPPQAGPSSRDAGDHEVGQACAQILLVLGLPIPTQSGEMTFVLN